MSQRLREGGIELRATSYEFRVSSFEFRQDCAPRDDNKHKEALVELQEIQLTERLLTASRIKNNHPFPENWRLR